MENVNTGVLYEHYERYLRCKDKAEKSYDVLRHMQLHMSKYKKNEDLFTIHYIQIIHDHVHHRCERVRSNKCDKL